MSYTIGRQYCAVDSMTTSSTLGLWPFHQLLPLAMAGAEAPALELDRFAGGIFCLARGGAERYDEYRL
jgi:hypothetical protein